MLSLNALLEKLDKDHDPLAARANALELARSLDKSLKVTANANLYGISMAKIIGRIVRDYAIASTRKISTGRVNEAWTEKKIKLASELEYITENALPDNRLGEDFRSDLIQGIENYKTERLPAARKEFNDEHQWMPVEGNFEKHYLPLIEQVIDLVFRVYCLYQIEDKTGADFRVSPNGNEHSIMVVQLAHALAERSVDTLLHDFSFKSIETAKEIVNEIEKQHSKRIVVTKAAQANLGENSISHREIEQLLSINQAFVAQFSEVKQRNLSQANQNIGSYTKHAAFGAMTTASSAVSLLGNTGTYLTEKLLDLAVGSTSGPSGDSRTNDDDDDDDESPYIGPFDAATLKASLMNGDYLCGSTSSASAVSGSALIGSAYQNHAGRNTPVEVSGPASVTSSPNLLSRQLKQG